MKPIGRLTIGLTLAVLVGGFVGKAGADDTKHFKANYAGTFLSTRMDIFPTGNPDGSPAGSATAVVKDKFGESSLQSIAEYIQKAATEECPGGVFIIDTANGEGRVTATQSYRNGKDQIYYEYTTVTLCSDGETYTQPASGIIVGGAGRFAGVSGTFEDNSSGFFQYADFNAVPLQFFGSFIGSFEAWITFPDGDDDDSSDDD